MTDADDLKFEKRTSGQKILILQKTWDPIELNGIKNGDRVKLRHESAHIAVEVVACEDANVYTGNICAFESSCDKINFVSIGGNFNNLTIGQNITFRFEHIFFLNFR